MPNCDFYAVGEDHRRILEYVLSLENCDIYELASRPDQPLLTFRRLSDFERRFDIGSWETGSAEAMLLQLHPKAAGGIVATQRVELDADRCNGATFRYNSIGWGLIQLYLQPPRNGRIPHSHTNHNSQARARAWSDAAAGLGDPEDWDWAAVAAFSRRLNRYINKIAVSKAGSRPVLPLAARMRGEGREFS